MALNANTLGALMKSKVDSLTDSEKRNGVSFYIKLAEAVVEHITGNLELETGSLSSNGTGNMGAPVSSQNTNSGTFK